MSADPGYMLIRVDLQGSQQAAAEMAGLRGEIVGTSEAAAASNAATTRSSTKSNRAAKGAGKAWSTAGKAAKVGMLGVVGGAAVLGITGVKAADHLKDLGLVAAGLSRNLGLTAREGSRWAAVAESRGIAPTSLNMGFKTLAQNLTLADKEGGTYMDNLRMIGITHEDVAKGTKDFDGFLTTVVDRFGEMEGGAKRQTAAAKLLGRGYQTLLPLFSKGSEGLEEQLGWADKYHTSFGQDMVDDTVKLAMAERESKVAWAGIQKVLGSAFLPILTDAHDEFQDFAKDITDPKLSSEEKISIISDKLGMFARKAGRLVVQVIPDIASHVGQAAPKIAVALFQGFIHADIWGKLAIGFWLTSRIAGSKMLSAVAIAGGKIGMKIGSKIALTILGWIAGTEIGGSLINMLPTKLSTVAKSPKATSAAKAAGGTLGRSFALGFATFGGILFADLFNDWLTESEDAIPSSLRELFGIEQGGPTGETDPGQLDLGGGTGLDALGNMGGDDDSDEEINLDPSTPAQKVAPGTGRRNVGQPPKGKDIDTGGGVGGGGRGGSDKVEPTDVHLDGKKVGQVMWRRARSEGARR